jgi:hypothetical protein
MELRYGRLANEFMPIYYTASRYYGDNFPSAALRVVEEVFSGRRIPYAPDPLEIRVFSGRTVVGNAEPYISPWIFAIGT